MHIPSILLIEDSPDYTEIITDFLINQGGYTNITSVPAPHEAYEALRGEDFDLIICDLHLPFITDHRLFRYHYSVEVGVRTIEELRSVFPNKPFLAITASLDSDEPITKRLRDIVPILRKPFSSGKFIGVVNALLETSCQREMVQ